MKTLREIQNNKNKSLRLKKLEVNTGSKNARSDNDKGTYGLPRNVRELGS